MNPETLDAWGMWYGQMHGFPESLADTVRVWISEFAITGYSVPELVTATRAIASLPAEKAPRYPGDHYAALVRELQMERARVRKADSSAVQNYGSERGVCELCGGSRWVVVPHLKYLDVWADAKAFVTFAVACRCGSARAMLADWPAKQKRPMTLEEYERQCPAWHNYAQQERNIRQAKVRTAGVMSAAKLGNQWTAWKEEKKRAG